MGIFLAGLIWTLAAAVVAATLAYLLRRPEIEGRSESNVVVGQAFTIVSGLNAVLLAFVLIGLFDAVGAAREDSYTEAGSLVAAAWAGEALPEPARSRIRTLSIAYARTVAEQEWPRMRAAGPVQGIGWAQLEDLRQAVADAKPADYHQTEQKIQAERRLWEVYESRQDRLKSSAKRVGMVMWFTLIASSLLSITLMYFMTGTKPAAYVAVAVALTSAIALLLFAIYQLQTPFHGGAQIGPDAFEAALQQLGSVP
jgi:Protein of unknown function (DUF4239)